jgi:hypothetical protein
MQENRLENTRGSRYGSAFIIPLRIHRGIA